MPQRRTRRRPKKRTLDYGILILGFALIVALGILIGVSFANEYTIDLRLTGPVELTLEYGSVFTDPGAEAVCSGTVFRREPFQLEVKTSSNVDTAKVGEYTITYTAAYSLAGKTLTRTVRVVDTQKPVITLVSDPEHFTLPGQPYEEEGFTATDGYDGDLTHKVQRQVTDTEVIYTVEDSSGNLTEVRRPIRYDDPVAPVLTLLGDAEITIQAGASFAEPGYTAVDNLDGDLQQQVNVSGNVNIWAAGTYTITYTVTDSFGNTATATRKIHVQGGGGSSSEGNGKVIYLTFDDGPSKHTLELLEVLAKYNVKATFFVTGSARLEYLPQIVAGGHSIGLHSVTHKYHEIYANEEAFFKDLYGIQSLVEQRIGYKTWLMRFPGGSSNKESAKHDNGIKIMSRLVKEVEKRGFHYFDWNVDSNDAGGAKTAAEVFKNVTDGCSKNRNYFIVLQHDIQGFSVDAVEDIIIWGLSNGYTFERLTESSPGSHHPVNN